VDVVGVEEREVSVTTGIGSGFAVRGFNVHNVHKRSTPAPPFPGKMLSPRKD
jgi:hypothetical protein